MLDSVKYAAITPGPALAGGGELLMCAGLLVIGIPLMMLPAARRRRIMFGVILALALAATQLGCGGGGGNNHPFVFSSQQVSAVTATFTSGGAVGVSGLPAKLGTIVVF